MFNRDHQNDNDGPPKGRRKRKSVNVTDRFTQVQSYNSNLTHVLDRNMNPPRVLCGYVNWVPTATEQTVTVETVKETSSTKEITWCPTCGSILTGRPTLSFQ